MQVMMKDKCRECGSFILQASHGTNSDPILWFRGQIKLLAYSQSHTSTHKGLNLWCCAWKVNHVLIKGFYKILYYLLSFGQKEEMETEHPDRRNIRCNLDFFRKKFKHADIDVFKFVSLWICQHSNEASEIVTI